MRPSSSFRWPETNGEPVCPKAENQSYKRRVEYDLDYLRNWSLGLDLTILLRTASLVWRDRNAY